MPFLGVDPSPGEIRRERVNIARLADGSPVYVPVVAIRGRQDGPTSYLQAGIHGDEATGIEVLRRVLAALDPDSLRGLVVAVPIGNVPAFLTRSRFFVNEERTAVDMNRIFPGDHRGLLTERIAAVLVDEFLLHAQHAIDFHSALAGCRIPPCTYIGEPRGHPVHEGQERIADGLALDFTCYQEGVRQTGPTNLARSFCAIAADAGIPAVIAELGESQRVTWEYVDRGVTGTLSALAALGHLPSQAPTTNTGASVRFRDIAHVYSDFGGLLNPFGAVGQLVKAGDPLMSVFDPVSGNEETIVSPVDGFLFRQMLWASCNTGAEVCWVAHNLVQGNARGGGS
jgi:predicted deacylase